MNVILKNGESLQVEENATAFAVAIAAIVINSPRERKKAGFTRL